MKDANEPKLAALPSPCRYVEVIFDGIKGTWYQHSIGQSYQVVGDQEELHWRVITIDENGVLGERLLPVTSARFYTGVLEYLKECRIFELYEDSTTGDLVAEEACGHCFSTTLSKRELEQLAHEILLFAWDVE